MSFKVVMVYSINFIPFDINSVCEFIHLFKAQVSPKRNRDLDGLVLVVICHAGKIIHRFHKQISWKIFVQSDKRHNQIHVVKRDLNWLVILIITKTKLFNFFLESNQAH